MSSGREQHRIGFIGAGRMATALARGLAAGPISADRIRACDCVASARKQFESETGASTVNSINEIVEQSDLIVLAVKPQQLPEVLNELRDVISGRHLVVSIAAGVRISTILESLGSDCRLVRVMPNTPCLVGAGACAISAGGTASDKDTQTVEQLLSAVGVVVHVPEHLFDAVTGLSGSGPAYVFQIIEALSDGGVRGGLPREVATRLAAQTVLGAARMVLETGDHPGRLKDAVASPSGTTIAGLHALERGGLRGCLMDAVAAATERSRELG